jgi:hypothetical protein
MVFSPFDNFGDIAEHANDSGVGNERLKVAHGATGFTKLNEHCLHPALFI